LACVKDDFEETGTHESVLLLWVWWSFNSGGRSNCVTHHPTRFLQCTGGTHIFPSCI